MKKLLMVAFHFPPLAGSSGIQRTLRFAQHLPAYGWQPIVVTAHPRAYEATNNDLLSDIPSSVVVERAFALDTARHLAIAGRHFGFMARPDRWRTWKWGAVSAGMKLIRQMRPAAIWSTFPIATAHSIGATLHERSRLPWIADFRDPMAQEGYPADPLTWRSFKDIEENAVRRASRCVFVTSGAARVYRERYPDVPGDRLAVIENGYDEESFAQAASAASDRGPLVSGRITLLHSGILYPSERDPTQLFAALQRMKSRRELDAQRFCIRFRAPVHERPLRALIDQFGIGDLVEIVEAIPYRQALLEMTRADGLLLMQAANCNEQVPAKFYEYLRAGRPVLGLTDHAGDTAAAMRAAGLPHIAALDQSAEIETELARLIAALDTRSAVVPGRAVIEGASRKGRAAELAAMLDRLSAGAAA